MCRGSGPSGNLVQASDGNFYGITISGGVNNTGTAFRITPSGSLTTLYSFASGSSAYPVGGLIQGSDGNLYGTTTGFFNGTVFRITLSGKLTVLHNFTSPNGGNTPEAGLVQDTSGKLYGTTAYGGTWTACGISGCGSLFVLDAGLRAFVEVLPSSGLAGRHVRILGTNLTGTTSLTFNGTPATFAVVSPSLITTTVPAGATTGTVQVVTPGGTLSSNVPFRVIP
ncbi:MAG TPA: choice-of-anchor tandem repeat GloVer-containing protein [Terriglobia bacterium]|nr:choice-of-anchor tandem repeat GloVer-containing protein [Terriglobia bacterium]